MSVFHFSNVAVSGISVILGENELCIDNEHEYFGNDLIKIDRLKKIIGIGCRYNASVKTTSLDLCYMAIKDLLNSANVAISDIDGIVSITQTPDYHMPGNAHVLHGKMKMRNNSIAIDINSGCSGYIYGLCFSSMLISNGFNRVLLVAGDTMSKSVNKLDKSEFPIFSDAGSATLLERDNSTLDSYFILKTDGRYVKKMYQRAGAYRIPSSSFTKIEKIRKDGNIRSDENFFVDGFKIFDKSMTEQAALLKEMMQFSKYTQDDIDFFISHQSNSYIVDTIAKKNGVPDSKSLNIFGKYGNQSSASIPCVICDKLRNINKEVNVMLHGLGVGLSYGACLLSLKKDIILLEPQRYRNDR